MQPHLALAHPGRWVCLARFKILWREIRPSFAEVLMGNGDATGIATASMVASSDTTKTMTFRAKKGMWNENGILPGDMVATAHPSSGLETKCKFRVLRLTSHTARLFSVIRGVRNGPTFTTEDPPTSSTNTQSPQQQPSSSHLPISNSA